MKPIFFRYFLLFTISISSVNCGVALTPRLTAKIPSEAETEVFRLNLIYGELRMLCGINVGVMNFANRLIGTQIGIINSAENASGLQIGFANNAGSKYGALKIGIFNFNFFLDSGKPLLHPGSDMKIETQVAKNASVSIGAANILSGRLNFGIFNWGEGLHVGLVNMNEGSSVSLGIVNIGTNLEISPKEKRAISFGIFNSGTHKEEFQIGIINYCPNNTIPILILANYCSQSESEIPDSTPKNEIKTESSK
ncbi:hypothetical protein JWG45_00815 [Leptospira sp. 201903070]|uniref:PPE family protein n=1 Tax=Leptospira ainlahdjerensis TaxID=2810033 RepID=A0ABS2U5M9_9LEPT|nr:hypothetical protein [Leptospira ainlahdjerensis]MBM9575682.1 hypothetical protein [Leptospira ainlahdjerensis]